MSEKVIKLYRDLVAFAGCKTDREDFIYMPVNGDKRYLTVDGQQLALPTREQLRTGGDKLIFHPLRENLMRGESEILKKYRNTIALRLNVVAFTIGQNLLNVAASPALQKDLTSDQIDLVTTLGDIDETTLANFLKVIATATKKDPHKTIISLFLNKGGSLLKKRYARTCVVTSPLYEELVSDQDKVFGVKIRVKDREAYLRLLKFMFPNIDQQHGYSVGSDSRIAPSLEALMMSTAQLAACLNTLLEQYGQFIEDAEQLIFPSDWFEEFENLEALSVEILKIPSQAGNEGSVRADQKEEIKAETPAAQEPEPGHYPVVQAPTVPVYPTNVMPTPPVTAPVRSGPPSVSELLAKSAGAVPPAPMPGMMPPGMMPGMMGYPPGMVPNMGMPPGFGMPTATSGFGPTNPNMPGYIPPWQSI